LFGYAGRLDTIVNSEDNGYELFDTENRPTIADVQYHDTLRDFLDRSSGWYEKAIEVLSP